MRLNRDQVMQALGEVDDVVVAQIIGAGATPGELAEAQAWVGNDEALLNCGKPLPGGRVGQLADILISLKEEKAETADASPPA
jgi:hypothetical protein